ncbi:negative regulator of beta-lactamase expression [Rhodobacteraceae bacterium HIMB11]|nr:negative regulator of beta-lactamase expression [Rhodobacteraceae bacterium HIMB11]
MPNWVILHYTAMNSAAEAIERLCDPVHQVSAHYVISESGAVTQLVSDDMRAWHAGQSYWQGCRDMNSASIGIELCNRGDHPFPAPQIRALITLLSGVCTRNGIPPNSVIGHSDIALARKADPGARFDWRALAQMGFGIWVDAVAQSGVDAAVFDANLGRIGYDPDAPLETRLRAFRLHFRPAGAGPLGAVDCAVAKALADKFQLT